MNYDRVVDTLKLIVDLWPIALGVMGGIVWLVRLEGRVSECYRYVGAVDKRIDVLSTKHDSLDSKTVEQLAQVRESLARIEGALGVKATS